MSEMIRMRGLLTALIAVFAACPLVAAEQSPSMMSETELEHVERGMDEGVPWLTGGVGENERNAIMSAVSGYNLRLEFANADGNYLGDVDVLIEDVQGDTALNVVSGGPWLLTKLPAGEYLVRARAAGQTFSDRVSVPHEGMRAVVFDQWSAVATSGPPH